MQDRKTLTRTALKLQALICDGYADLRAMPQGTPLTANAARYALLASQEEQLAELTARIVASK